jgi:uncharacterized protein (TIGR03435 family)
MRAYNVAERQFTSVGSSLPILTGRYDIEAKAPHPATRAEMMRMLQALLVERFRLAMHREPKEVSGYVLLTDAGGAKLRESESGGPECKILQVMKGDFREFQFRNCTLQSFALEPLGPWLGEFVVDQSGMTGQYDFDFLFSRDQPANPREGRPEPSVFNPGAPSIPTALKQQLGLRLQAQKITVDLYSIDHVEKPSQN